jgi:hypothetical protein
MDEKSFLPSKSWHSIEEKVVSQQTVIGNRDTSIMGYLRGAAV